MHDIIKSSKMVVEVSSLASATADYVQNLEEIIMFI